MRNKITCIVFFTILSDSTLHAQFIGINTTSPQATLDVKGTQRVGGISNYVKYDSATGRIEWNGASLWAPISQQIIKHSASNEGLYAGGGKLEYRNSTSTPVFFSDWTNGNGYFSGNLGIGVVSPTAKFQLRDGASGITPFSTARMVVETNNHTYVNLLAPDPFETGILFGSTGNAVSGLISYNSTTVPKGFIFNNNGNLTRMVITNAGNVGIGVTDPQQTLSLKGGMNIDQTNLNHGAIDNNILRFGGASGEAIGSARGSGDNLYGLDFYAGGLKRMVITNGGNVGIGVTDPTLRLDISGRMRIRTGSDGEAGIWLNNTANTALQAFVGLENDNYVGFYGNVSGWKFGMNTQTGALKINGNEGSAGQVIQSNGAGSSSSWASSTNTLYNNSIKLNSTSPLNLAESNPETQIPGLSYTFSVGVNAKVFVSFTLPVSPLFCSFCVGTNIRLFMRSNGTQIGVYNQRFANDGAGLMSGSNLILVGPGSYTIALSALISGPNMFFYSNDGTFGGCSMIVQVIPQ